MTLGRRVLKRIYQEGAICDISSRCDSYIDRMVWDGDQLLWELRQENTESSLTGDAQKPSDNTYRGTLSYIHAGGIDAPVGLVKNGSPVILHRNWRGLFAFSTDTDGELTTCTPSETTGCDDFPWPARAPWSYWYDPHVKDTHLWYGTLPLDQADETGLSYRRNRYYDGRSGQFTQQDPIGIAGGLNLYGYANGDPINFSDPFGLSPCDDIKDETANAECFKEKEEQAAEEEVGGFVDRFSWNLTIFNLGISSGGLTGEFGVPSLGASVSLAFGRTDGDVAAHISLLMGKHLGFTIYGTHDNIQGGSINLGYSSPNLPITVSMSLPQTGSSGVGRRPFPSPAQLLNPPDATLVRNRR